MWPLGVVEAEVGVQVGLGLPAVGVGLQVNLLILDRPPQSFHEYVVAVAPLSVHADLNPVLLQEPVEGLVGELPAGRW